MTDEQKELFIKQLLKYDNKLKAFVLNELSTEYFDILAFTQSAAYLLGAITTFACDEFSCEKEIFIDMITGSIENGMSIGEKVLNSNELKELLK
jgi:hypothetical protein